MINNRQNNRRRGRGGGPRPNGPNTGNDRGNRIDNRSRGNASQLFEKYKTLARDSQMQGDRVMSEYYFQFADHYFRVLNENRSRFEEQNRGRPDQNDREDQYDYGDDNDGGPDNSQPAYVERVYREPPANLAERDPAPVEVSEEPVRAYGANGYNESNGQPQAEPTRNGRGRPPRVRKERPADTPLLDVAQARDQEERIEIDRLPPAFAAVPEAEVSADKPKRRGRPRRSESTTVEV